MQMVLTSRFDELHGVVDREPGGHDAARRVDIERNVLVRVLGLEEQHLGDHDVRHVVLDRANDEDQAVLQEARIDVVCPLAARRLLDDHRDQVQCSLVHVLGPSLTTSPRPRSDQIPSAR